MLGWATASQCLAQTTIATESGDAGDSRSVYQTLFGSGSLTAITGTITATTDVDIFRITISNAATFSARTDTSPGTLNDTQLFLFTLGGAGIAANDDISGKLKSLLPAGDSRLTALSAGDYLLAISGYNRDAYDATNGLIFPSSPFTDVFGPNAGVGVLDHWSSNSGGTGTYNLTLTGASFVTAVPEPATTTLILASGCAAVALMLRRKSRRDTTD